MDDLARRVAGELVPFVGYRVRVSGRGSYRDDEIHEVDLEAGTVTRTRLDGGGRQVLNADQIVISYAGFTIEAIN